jgi:glucose/arabinose dehydrogenase
MLKFILGFAVAGLAAQAMAEPVLTGAQAFGNWKDDHPGVERKFSSSDIPPPKQGTEKEKPDLYNGPHIVDRGNGMPVALPGFAVELFASGLHQPRIVRVAPNGDIFVAESGAGRVLVFPASEKGEHKPLVFADGLSKPFGLAFYPAGPNPQFLYVGEPSRILRFTYKNGQTAADHYPQTILNNLPSEHHWTRDVVPAPDGQNLFYSIGSGSNDGGGTMDDMSPDRLRAFIASHPLGQAWGEEEGRAEVREFDPDGKNVQTYATGLRNCVSLAIQPDTNKLWCVVNERDDLGDNTPPEYATSVKRGAFYGWPWYYIGDNQDPRWPNARPDLKGHVTIPDVLMQAHTAPLGIAFYAGSQFPAEYRGDAFVTMHGSWDRTVRGGYKVVRLCMHDGEPTGVVEDFLTGFVVNDTNVWGRPVDVAIAKDGSLLVSDDGSNSIWRVRWKGR